MGDRELEGEFGMLRRYGGNQVRRERSGNLLSQSQFERPGGERRVPGRAERQQQSLPFDGPRRGFCTGADLVPCVAVGVQGHGILNRPVDRSRQRFRHFRSTRESRASLCDHVGIVEPAECPNQRLPQQCDSLDLPFDRQPSDTFEGRPQPLPRIRTPLGLLRQNRPATDRCLRASAPTESR